MKIQMLDVALMATMFGSIVLSLALVMQAS